MVSQPIDYRTYSTILDKADALVRKSTKGLTRLDALHVLKQAYPEDYRYAAAVRMASRSSARARAARAEAAQIIQSKRT